jgi:glyoxylase-like metal-dependent hydrolase (beta-lactamase superfamily II)
MDTPEPPFNIGSREESTTLDLKNGRIMSEQKGSGAGFAFWNRALAKGSEAWNIDLRNRIVTPGPPGSTTQPVYQQYYRRMPALILRTALDRALTLRWVGEDNFRGRKHNVITYAQNDGNQVALYFDAQNNLLSKYELLFIDALNGEDVSEIEFADYQAFGPLKFPTVWRNRLAGDTASDMKVSDVAVNTKLEDKAFEIPEGLEKAPTPPQGQPITVSKLADDVVLVRDTGGGNYNVLAVGFKDHILVVEAPQNSVATETALARIKEAIPGKPIKYVAITHHHSDHSGGLRTFIAEGATVVTTPGNRRFVEVMAASRQNDRLSRSPRKPIIETIEGKKRVFTDGEQVVELHDIGPNPHAKEMVVAYLPKHKILFQGDLFNPPIEGPVGAAQDGTVHFSEQVKKLGFTVDKLIGVHGRDATIAELQKSIEERVAMDRRGSSPAGASRTQ